MSRSTRTAAIVMAGLLPGAGCLVDKDHPCDENQVELKGTISGCLCTPGSVLKADGSGCIPCRENEVIKGGKCECDTGYAPIDGRCQLSSLGSPCSAETPCATPFSFCAAKGYCTSSGCGGNQDCTGGYWCDKSAATSFCSAPPTGLGVGCTTSAECADFEAARCAQGSCVVGGCAAAGAPRCFSDYACCDYTALAPSVGDICVPPSSLSSGKCPGSNSDPVVRP